MLNKLIEWVGKHKFLSLMILVFVTFIAGVTFESQSVSHAFEGIIYPEYECYHKASEIASYTGIPFTNDLRNRECNEIDWLYDKIQKHKERE